MRGIAVIAAQKSRLPHAARRGMQYSVYTALYRHRIAACREAKGAEWRGDYALLRVQHERCDKDEVQQQHQPGGVLFSYTARHLMPRRYVSAVISLLRAACRAVTRRR